MGEHSRNHVASHVHCHRSPCHRCRCLQLLLILWLLRALRRTLLWPCRPCCRYCYWHCWRRWCPRQRPSAKAFRRYHSDSYLRRGPWPLRSDCCPDPPVQQAGVHRRFRLLLHHLLWPIHCQRRRLHRLNRVKSCHSRTTNHDSACHENQAVFEGLKLKETFGSPKKKKKKNFGGKKKKKKKKKKKS